MGLIPGVGALVDSVADAIGLPEVVGDIAKIGLGVATGNAALIADGVLDITPNVCDFLQQQLDLGPAEPGEPDSFWKELGRHGLDLLRGEAEAARKNLPQAKGTDAGVSAGVGSLITALA